MGPPAVHRQVLPICGEVLWIDTFIIINILFCMLALLQWIVAQLSIRSSWFSDLVRSRPRLLVEDGDFRDGAMRDERVTRAEVEASIRKSGIGRMDDFVKYNFKCHVGGKPSVDPAEHVDKRVYRFMSEGAGWNYMAMEQAIADAGLEERDISHPRTGIIMGSGGPSAGTIVNAADITRDKGPRRVGPFAVPKAMSSTASATLATPFKILGVNYSITSACSTTASTPSSGSAGRPLAAGSSSASSPLKST